MSNIKVGDEIEITSCLMNTYWYRGKEGQKFTVVGERYNSFAVGDGTSFILKQDCKLVSHDNLKDMLTNGRRVKLRNGKMFTVLDDALLMHQPSCKGGLAWQSSSINESYDNSLINTYSKNYDILDIYEKPRLVVDYLDYEVYTKLIWQREEKTAKQIQLEALQKQAQDVADAIKKLQDEE